MRCAPRAAMQPMEEPLTRKEEKKTELAIKKNSVDSLQPVSHCLTYGPEDHVQGKQRSRGGEVSGVQLRPANREERCFLYVLIWPFVLFISQYPKLQNW